MTREELLKSPEYWKLEFQMELYEIIDEYMNNNNLNRKQLADKLGVTKGYISQILNGDFDHRLSKFIELSLSVGKVPVIFFEDLEDIVINDMYNNFDVKKSERFIINLKIGNELKISLPEKNSKTVSITKNNFTNNDISLNNNKIMQHYGTKEEQFIA